MTKTTTKPAARKSKAASRSTARQAAGNRRKTTPVSPVKANSPKAKGAPQITTRAGLTKPARTTKLMLIIGLLRRGEGATLAELVAVTGWQAHSVRGALAGALRQRGFAIESTKTDGIRRYRITQADEVDQADEATS